MTVRLGKDARKDLRSLFVYVGRAAGVGVADAYDSRIRTACYNLASHPNGGTPRDDLRAGLRTFAFERRVTIAYEVDGDIVRVLRIVYGGRDLGGLFPPAAAKPLHG